MATSGTYLFGDTQQLDFITEAFERCGKLPDKITANDMDSARRSINFLFSDWSNQGINLWEVDLVELPLDILERQYTLDVETVCLLQVYTRTTSGGIDTDLVIQPISRGEYAALPNKEQSAQRPTQFYFERTTVPSLYVWPVPDNADVTLFYYRMKIQQDAGAFTDSLDAPNRWMEAIASGLAAKLATKFAPERLSFLKAEASAAFDVAAAEDRERVPLRITIDQSGGW